MGLITENFPKIEPEFNDNNNKDDFTNKIKHPINNKEAKGPLENRWKENVTEKEENKKVCIKTWIWKIKEQINRNINWTGTLKNDGACRRITNPQSTNNTLTGVMDGQLGATDISKTSPDNALPQGNYVGDRDPDDH